LPGWGKHTVAATIALHPTAAEELVTMREKWQLPGTAGGKFAPICRTLESELASDKLY